MFLVLSKNFNAKFFLCGLQTNKHTFQKLICYVFPFNISIKYSVIPFARNLWTSKKSP